ncbi:hypothetical protein [Streptomyces sp. NPDC047525]|uniref:hypothetical protein n=1 Tax=Streptomyces sp. NPDC047525 TaxID=3155264 RepID=UPI0033FC1141
MYIYSVRLRSVERQTFMKLPGTPAVCAVFRGEGGTDERPILGWDDEGYALTADWNEGRLKRATDIEGFLHLDDQQAMYADIRSVLPAPEGWYLVSGPTESRTVYPIVGWTVNGFGCGDPLVVDSSGYMNPESTQGKTVCPPGRDPRKIELR